MWYIGQSEPYDSIIDALNESSNQIVASKHSNINQHDQKNIGGIFNDEDLGLYYECKLCPKCKKRFNIDEDKVLAPMTPPMVQAALVISQTPVVEGNIKRRKLNIRDSLIRQNQIFDEIEDD